MTHLTPIKQRLHITFGKAGALKYTSNLDLAKVWERVLRRADLPLLYTQGFNTRPRLQLASALPLGITSECEIIDVALREPLPTLDGLAERIMAVSPAGLDVYNVVEVSPRSSNLQSLVRSAEYRITFADEVDLTDLQERIDQILATESIIKRRERKRKVSVLDLRPMIHDLQIEKNGDLIAHLAAGDHGNLRPDDILAEMGLADLSFAVHRFRLNIQEYETLLTRPIVRE